MLIMDGALTPRLLDKTTIDRAFPLVRSLVPAMTQERWTQFARLHLASRSPHWPRGLMTIQSPGAYILGLFVFDVRDDLYETRALCIDNIIVPNLPGRDLVWAAIVDAAEHLATMNGCRVIRAGLADELDPNDTDRAWLSASLEKAGYSLEGMRALKRVGHAASRASH
jgi:hypothetical protein